MSDWRQIQARIRKAKTAADPVVQLSALYDRTHDPMVAFELARHHEKIGENHEAARWYTSAAERFRRAQWKIKAQEALTRLGVPIPPSSQTSDSAPAESVPDPEPAVAVTEFQEASDEITEELAAPLAQLPSENDAAVSPASEPGAVPARKRRRRGRRGGRGRRRGTAGAQPLTPGASESAGEPTAESRPRPSAESRPELRPESRIESRTEAARPALSAPQIARPAAGPGRAPAQARTVPAGFESLESSPSAQLEPAAPQLRGRTGDPGLSSRMAQLESLLRRLLAFAPVSLDQAAQAPAGPGVFIVSDSDQVTYYYVEACQTLRIGIANLLRADRAGTTRRTSGDSLREKFAEHLEISESKVSKYLKDHCSVRWIQLDEGARLLAHFAIAVLRPALND